MYYTYGEVGSYHGGFLRIVLLVHGSWANAWFVVRCGTRLE